MAELEQELAALGDDSMATRPRNRHKTVQVVGTPPEFIEALEGEFGPLGWDLAATAENAKAPRYITPEIDSLAVHWHALDLITNAVNHPSFLMTREYHELLLLYGERTVDLVLEQERSARARDLPICLVGRFAYLNPPFKQSGVWIRKCAAEAARGARLIVLLQASIDTEYYRDHIVGKCECRLMKGRLRFTGHKTQFPKALMTLVFEPGRPARTMHWDWRTGGLTTC
jgi:hypothetical protein